MKLAWNPAESCFEAVFQDFQNDLLAVKEAGFKTTGAPSWKWFTSKIAPLDKLRQNRPSSGLTITEDALTEYKRIKGEDEKRAALLAELKEKKKELKQEEVSSGQVIDLETEVSPDGFICYKVDGADSNRKPYTKFVPPDWTGPVCYICKGPVYFYESQEPPTCLSCEIGELYR